MTNKEAIDRLSIMQGRCENGYDEEALDLAIKAIEMLDTAPTVEDERIVRALETIQTVIDNTNGNMDNVSKAMRNTAKFIRNAIDGEMPDYENVEGEDCGERPTGEWNEVEEGCGWTEILCAECSVCKNTFVLGEMAIDEVREDFKFCPNCGAKMKGGAE